MELSTERKELPPPEGSGGYPALRRRLGDDPDAWADLERMIRDIIERERREREEYRRLPPTHA